MLTISIVTCISGLHFLALFEIYGACPEAHTVLNHSPQLIVLIGERHSGTNYLENFLKANLISEYHTFDHNLFNYKHWFQFPGRFSLVKRMDTLVIAVFRNPYDWLLAMHGVCWHCAYFETLPFSQFLTAVWKLPPSYQPEHRSVGDDEEQFVEVNPVDQGHFSNVYEMRITKILNFLNLTSSVWRSEVVRYEDVLTAQQARLWLRGLAARNNLKIKTKLVGVPTYKGFTNTSFDAVGANERSAYLNKKLAASDPNLGAKIRSINELFHPLIESMAGYSMLSEYTS